MIVRLWIGLRHRLGVSAAFAVSLRHSSVMVHAPLLSHSLRNGKISSKILPETFAHWCYRGYGEGMPIPAANVALSLFG
ncbi:hypothetical protein [Rubritalea tangerina]|uniref:hypothetical protein n=1 Tax=Rubritalea tangerina TaxID=430798 RepID=UPI003612385C